ncbi:DUF5700 domain-containing putative Zn-dependent protease [Pontibacter roseus]|uniref:DUF5700 domain-containing putative Zn-dependent protease n=1 Tax=Pontibacter roseus TaxID=336989 RepID=UPI00037EB868|nr:DUF5700 domain-containing putative Zn-dependent protease [Pontibacter roseus]
MKKLFTLLLLAAASHSLNAQTIDAAAAHRYYELTDSLKAGKRLSDGTWNSFFKMDGNRQYIDNQAYDEKYLNNYRKAMEVVYMPENDSLLQARLKDPHNYYLTYLIHHYKEDEAALRTYLEGVTANPEGYLESMYASTYTMLPKRLHTKKPDFTVYLIALNNDAVANRDNFVLNLWGEYQFDKAKPGIVGGHELHHLLSRQKKYEVAEKDQSLLLMLQLLLNEGAPDLIDKKYLVSPNVPEELQYGTYLLQLGERQMPKVDAAIKEMAAGTRTYTSQELKQQVIGMSGHVPGFYMADVIERNGLRNKLVAHIDNPFQFIYLYNKAARKDKAKPYVFSEEAMAYLKKVESGAKVKN